MAKKERNVGYTDKPFWQRKKKEELYRRRRKEITDKHAHTPWHPHQQTDVGFCSSGLVPWWHS